MKLYVIGGLTTIIGLCMLSSYTSFSWDATFWISTLITVIMLFAFIDRV